MKKKHKNKKDVNEVNEPQLQDGLERMNNKIIICNSFEEQEDDMRKYWASLSPEKRMLNLHELICISFGLTPEKIKNPGLSDKIYIPSTNEYFI